MSSIDSCESVDSEGTSVRKLLTVKTFQLRYVELLQDVQVTLAVCVKAALRMLLGFPCMAH